jgi:NADH:ubiquinone oxidoreductase subunit H
MVGSLIIL